MMILTEVKSAVDAGVSLNWDDQVLDRLVLDGIWDLDGKNGR
jgi:hypothetical protein